MKWKKTGELNKVSTPKVKGLFIVMLIRMSGGIIFDSSTYTRAM